MNYRPYPDVDRALAQMERRRAPEGVAAWIDESVAPLQLTDWQRAWLDSTVVAHAPKRTGKTAITAAIVDQAVKAGHHVHVASRDGVRCAGGDESCPATPTEPPRCAGCGHGQHAPGAECEAGADHGGKRWHRCLCLATPGASRACPPQMDCQGGTLSYSDIWHLRQGRTLRGANGETITPDVLAEPQQIVLARVKQTCASNPAQWNALTADGTYLYLRYRFGVGTVSTSADFRVRPLVRFEYGGEFIGHMTLAEFCGHAGLQVAADAEVPSE